MIGQKRKRSASENRTDSVNSGISMETISSDLKSPRKEVPKSLKDAVIRGTTENVIARFNFNLSWSVRQAFSIIQFFGVVFS